MMPMSFYAVFGNPVAHSRSPQIHRLFARQQGLPIEYKCILAPLHDFGGAARTFFAHGGVGANVTVPFKTEAFKLSDEVSSRAATARAVNTLCYRPDGTIYGDNTDGVGLVQDITELQHFALAGRRVLLLGAGGAARGVIAPLQQYRPQSITLANRTAERARLLADDFGIGWVEFKAVRADYDVVINATSGSLHGDMLPVAANVLGEAELVYDMMYAAQLTPFLQRAQQAGAPRVVDGLGMLVAQAAASYERWRGFKPQLAPVVAAVRADMERL